MKFCKKHQKNTISKLLPIIIILLLFILFFSSVIFKGETFAGGDLINQYIPYKYFMRDTLLKHKQIPFWNPLYFSGRLFQADIQTGVFYPPNWFVIFFPPEIFFTIVTLLHILWGIFGMSCYTRLLVKNKFIIALGGILFGFSAFNITRLAEFSGVVLFIFTASWIPWILFFEEYFFRGRKVKHLIYLILSITFQLFAGSPQIAFYTWIALAVISLLQLIHIVKFKNFGNKKFSKYLISSGNFSNNLKGFIVGIVIACILSLGLFGIQFFPTHEFIKNSFERGGIGATFEYITSDSLTLPHLITYLIPKYFYDPTSLEITQFLKTGFHEYNFYSGISVIFFSLLFFLLISKNKREFLSQIHGIRQEQHRRRIAVSWIILAAFGLFASFGSTSLLFRFLYDYIPGFKSFRVPVRMMMFYWICSIVLTILTIDTIEKLGRKELHTESLKATAKKLRNNFIMSLFGAFIILNTVFIILFFSIYQIYTNLGIEAALKAATAEDISLYKKIYAVAASSSLRALGILLITFIICIAFFINRISKQLFNILILLIVCLDLFIFGRGFIFTKGYEEIHKAEYKQTDLVKFLQQNLKDSERYTWLDDVFDYRFDQNQLELYANRPMIYGLHEMRGYDPNFSSLYGEFLNAACGRNPKSPQGAFMSIPPDAVNQINFNLLSLFNLKYILSYNNLQLEHFKLVKQFNFGAQILKIYENEKPSGMIYFRKNAIANHPNTGISLLSSEFDPETEAIPMIEVTEKQSLQNNSTEQQYSTDTFKYEIIKDTPNYQKYKIKCGENGILVFAENYDIGWKVYVNDVGVEYFPVNHALGGIFIDKGEWTVEKRFRSASFFRGGFISLASLLFLIFLLSKGRQKSIKQ